MKLVLALACSLIATSSVANSATATQTFSTSAGEVSMRSGLPIQCAIEKRQLAAAWFALGG